MGLLLNRSRYLEQNLISLERNHMDQLISELGAEIKETIAVNEVICATAGILRSIPEVGPVADTILIRVPKALSLDL